MNKESLMLIITSIIASPFVAALIKSFVDKNKTSAEAQNIQITGEINIGDAWKKYAKKIEDDYKDLCLKFGELDRKFDLLKEEKEELAEATREKDRKIVELTERVGALELEVHKYKTIADTIQTAAHEAVDEIADKITHA